MALAEGIEDDVTLAVLNIDDDTVAEMEELNERLNDEEEVPEVNEYIDELDEEILEYEEYIDELDAELVKYNEDVDVSEEDQDVVVAKGLEVL